MPTPSLSALKNLKKIKLNLNLKKHKEEPTPLPTATKIVPRGLKVIERYPLYEPFAHVIIVQNPKTGENKYILDELQLDPLERNVYHRILEILLAEIESPKEELADPRKFALLRNAIGFQRGSALSHTSFSFLKTELFTQ